MQIHWKVVRGPTAHLPEKTIDRLVQQQETNGSTHNDQQTINCQKSENTVARRNGQK